MTEDDLDELDEILPDIFSEDNFFVDEIFNVVNITFCSQHYLFPPTRS